MICFAFEVETVLFALLPKFEPTFGLFWLSLILDYMLILTSSMSSIILLILNPLIKTTIKRIILCQKDITHSTYFTNYKIYEISDDYGNEIKEEKERRKIRKKLENMNMYHL